MHVFAGVDGEAATYGFDELLAEEGAGDLADAMTSKTEAAIAAIEAIDGSLYDAVTAGSPTVQAAYDAVKSLTDDLKGHFVTVLSLTVPQEGAGDND